MRKYPRTFRHAAGFTLSEVLIALGILAVGSVAVASLFPAALLLQKQAVSETLRQNHVRSMDALLLGNGLDNDMLLNFTDVVDQNTSTAHSPARILRNNPDTLPLISDVFALAEVDQRLGDLNLNPPENNIGAPWNGDATNMNGPNYNSGAVFVGTDTADDKYRKSESFLAQYPLSIRCLPTITPAQGVGAASAFAPDPDYANREVFWVPLIRRGIEASEIFGDWSVYVFVFQPDSELRENGAYARLNYFPTSTGANFLANLVCANPFDPAYFPKVFRLPVTWNSNSPNVAIAPNNFNLFGLLKPGDMALGDNGKIYKIALVSKPSGATGSTITLASQTIYEPLDDRDLTALWVAPAPHHKQSSPLAEIRLMSNAVVRVNGP